MANEMNQKEIEAHLFPIEAHLRPEEWKAYKNACAMCDENIDNGYDVAFVEALETLAACRQVMERADYNLKQAGYGIGQSEISGKKTIRMQIAACLAGLPGRVCPECGGTGKANYGFDTNGDPIDEMCRRCTP